MFSRFPTASQGVSSMVSFLLSLLSVVIVARGFVTGGGWFIASFVFGTALLVMTYGLPRLKRAQPIQALVVGVILFWLWLGWLLHPSSEWLLGSPMMVAIKFATLVWFYWWLDDHWRAWKKFQSQKQQLAALQAEAYVWQVIAECWTTLALLLGRPPNKHIH